MAWSNLIQRIPLLGRVYKDNYFSWKRTYLNVLRRWGVRPGPDVVHWLCTYRCNSKCAYCEASANEASCDELTTEEVVALLDELAELRVRRFFVTGGEPLTRPDLFEVLDEARSRGMSVSMITNSLLYQKFTEEIERAGFKSIWTSVDGLAETHDKNRGVEGSFATALDAIRFYRDLKIPLRVVNTMVHPGNLSELPGLFEALKSAGINRWRLALAIPVGRAADNTWTLNPDQIEGVLQYVELLRKTFDVELSEELGYLGCHDTSTRNTPFICPSGLTFCVVMPDGHVLPCQVVYDTSYSQGNLRERSFRDIWANEFRSFRKVELEGDCASCIHQKACSGGCWGRIVARGDCLRSIWDPENYGHERSAGERATAHP
jgi:radical SAM protein with 4Fe4S-binding SPASM domain